MLKGGKVLGMNPYQQKYYKSQCKILYIYLSIYILFLVVADWWEANGAWGTLMEESGHGKIISVKTLYAWNKKKN